MPEQKKYTPQELLNEIEDCREAIGDNPENLDLHLRLAHFLELNDNLPEAIQTYQAIVQKDAQHKKAYYRLGLCYSKSGFKNRAIDSLEAVLNFDPGNVEIWCNLGFIYWEIEDLSRARLCYSKAQELDSENEKVLHSLSLLNYLLKDYQVALELAKKLQNSAKEEKIENLLHLAMCYNAESEYQEALGFYEKVLSQNCKDPIFFNNYANCLKEVGKTEKAEEFYLKSLQEDAKNPNFNFNYGEFLYEQGKQKQAISYFQEVLRVDDQDLDALLYLARFFETENPKEGIKLYKKILEKEGNNIEVLNSVANIQEKFEMHSESIVNRKRIYALKKNHWGNNLILGQMLLKNKKITEGWEILKFNPLIVEKDIPLLEKIAESFQYHKEHLSEVDVLQLIVKMEKKHFKSWARLAEIVLKNKDVLRAYKYALNSEHFLQSDILFTGRLVHQLLLNDEVEKAIEISQYLIETLKIDPYLLSSILKNFQEKNVLEKWLENSKDSLKKQKNLRKPLEDIFLEMKQEDKIQQLQSIMQ